MTSSSEKDINQILDQYSGAGRESLIPLLQEVQESFGCLTRDMMVMAGKKLGIAPSKVYGVASFYNQFRFQPPGKFHIQLCRGTACHVKGSAAVFEALKRHLKIEDGRTTRDGVFSLEVVACIGACGLAPVISVNGEFFAGVTQESVVEIVESFRRKAAVE